MKTATTMLLALLAADPLSARASAIPDGVLSVTPVLEHACIAAEFEIGPDQYLAGLRWYNNDGQVEFPNVLIMEGAADCYPDVAQAAMIIPAVSGSSSAWGEIYFDAPVASSSGIIHAVFELPAGVERTGEGVGHGPGIGYTDSDGSKRIYLSPDGATWIAVRADFALSVEPILSLGRRSSATTLDALRSEAISGWWTDAEPNDRVLDATSAESSDDAVPSIVSATRPLAAYPNPFNPRVSVQFYVATPGRVNVAVFDVRGRRVRRLIGDQLSVGCHAVVWEGVDDALRPVASGVYFLRATTAEGPTTVRVALVR